MAGEKYEYGIDFDAIDAIDIHTHVEADGHGHHAYDDELIDGDQAVLQAGLRARPTVDARGRRTTGSATPPPWCSPSTRRR